MARRRKISTPPSSSPISIGNCEVVIEAKNFKSDSDQNSLQISISKTAKIKISVVEKEVIEHDNFTSRAGSEQRGDCYFVVVNPKDSDVQTKSLLQEVLTLYMNELPAMNYAANTGKESTFLERCVTNGKYCTLLLKSKDDKQPGEVIAAITYQIVPADTQYAEVPLAAVSSTFQHKGIGRLLYMELRKRLQSVGIRTVFCWGDKESEGFWLKQGFTMIGEVDKKGKARKLPVKANIRRALCFPGGSTLMVSHLLKADCSESVELLPLCLPTKCPELTFKNQEPCYIQENHEPSKPINQIAESGCSESENVTENFMIIGCQDAGLLPVIKYCSLADASGVKGGTEDDAYNLSCSMQGTNKRTWEASCTSLKSKKVKGTHPNDCQSGSRCPVWTSDGRIVNCIDRNCMQISETKLLSDGSNSMYGKNEECGADYITNEDYVCPDTPETTKLNTIMLMNIADANKKAHLTKIIEGLGGVVTSDGSVSTHVVTGQVRKTLNFCTALCSGAWVISSAWLKESFKNGRFVDEMPFVLNDEDYRSKYRIELKSAVLRAKAKPNALLKGLDIWLASHVQPPARTLSAIIKSAGGNVIWEENEINDKSKTIFVACEEDMDEALYAVKLGISTFSVDWLMSCVMKQELDLDAPQFAESL